MLKIKIINLLLNNMQNLSSNKTESIKKLLDAAKPIKFTDSSAFVNALNDSVLREQRDSNHQPKSDQK